jgi:hypothetical protein
LSWKPDEFGGLKMVTMSGKDLWIPDIGQVNRFVMIHVYTGWVPHSFADILDFPRLRYMYITWVHVTIVSTIGMYNGVLVTLQVDKDELL